MQQTPAQRRLAKYRARAADWLAKYPTPHHKYHDWRTHARYACTLKGGGTWQDKKELRCYHDRRAYYCDNWPDGIRDLGDAHDITRLDHTGWYADNWQTNLCRGRVLQFPARTGTPCYIPGTYMTDCFGVTLFPLDTYDDKEDCARAADQYAEWLAESEREYQAKDAAEFEIAERREEIVTLRADMRALIREIKAARTFGPAVCEALRERLLAMREDSHKAWKRISKLEENYWNAVPN